MKVLQKFQQFEISGIARIISDYARYLSKDGIQVDILTDYDLPMEPAENIVGTDGKITSLRLSKEEGKIRGYDRLCKGLAGYLKANKYDIIHISGSNLYCLICAFVAKKEGVKVRIVHAHTNAKYDKVMRITKQLNGLIRTLLQYQVTHYVACSQEAAAWMMTPKAYQKGRYYLLNNAIDVEHYQINPEIRERIRDMHQAKENFVVGHVGYFNYPKNHTFLLEVFEAILDKEPCARLWLAGKGELFDSMQEKARKLGIISKVSFLGEVEHIAEVLQGMDLFLFPSISEGMGRALIEAQASGLPVVCSDRIPDAVKMSDSYVTLPLEASATKWAEICLAMQAAERTDNRDELLKRGFDLQAEEIKLREFYETCMENR